MVRDDIIQAADLQMRKILEVAENVAASRAAILIQGESGTGKELLARFIHSRSSRASKKFAAINCAAVPENLLESELFGYEKGAFTGAESKKPGRFELANGGTFLFDEIGDMPIVLQAKLLRVLQEGELERLGGLQSIKVDVRIISTTHKNLAELVSKGLFREDLFYRLNVIPVEIPPLRNRPRDLDLLTDHFIGLSCSLNGIQRRELTEAARKKLHAWHWPGNVRELQNVIERAVLLGTSQQIGEEDILIKDFREIQAKNAARVVAPGMTVSEVEKLLIIKTLEYTNQNRTQAAHLLGISIRTLRNKLSEYRELEIR